MTNPMTTTDLRALAQASIEATAGWNSKPDYGEPSRIAWRAFENAHVAFAAVCTPETILALTARVESLEQTLRDILIACDYDNRGGYIHDAARAALNAKDVT